MRVSRTAGSRWHMPADCDSTEPGGGLGRRPIDQACRVSLAVRSVQEGLYSVDDAGAHCWCDRDSGGEFVQPESVCCDACDEVQDHVLGLIGASFIGEPTAVERFPRGGPVRLAVCICQQCQVGPVVCSARTTILGKEGKRAGDLLDRDFTASLRTGPG